MGRRSPAKISPRYLQWVTGRYLDRYATSKANLRRLLAQRVHRSARFHEVDPEPWMTLVDPELDRLVSVGHLDDARYAFEKARALHRRGNSGRAIRSKLMAKGVPSEIISKALARLDDGDGHRELRAALTFARKRRLGPWDKDRTEDWKSRKKKMAKFARAGFSFDVAAKILDAPDEASVSPDEENVSVTGF
jgi:regulatory protein